jgi:hypothetical protein
MRRVRGCRDFACNNDELAYDHGVDLDHRGACYRHNRAD